MAIRQRKDKCGGSWQVYWRNPYTQRQETCLCHTKREAQKKNDEIKYRLRYEPETFMTKPESNVGYQIDDSLEAIDYAYLQEKMPNDKALEWHLDGMRLPLELIGRKRIGDITRRDLSQVLAAQQARNVHVRGKDTGKKVKAVTVRGRMRILYTLIRWALKRGYIDALPVLPELPEGHYEKIAPPTPDETRRIIMAAPEHVRRVIVIGSKLGVRVGPSELFKMEWDDVDLIRDVVRVQAAKKNPREPWREVPIKSSLHDVFYEWRNADVKKGINHVIHYHGKPVASIETSWGRTLKRAGITRRIRPYDLRHAFATDAIAAGADIGTVAKIMGHTTPQMVLTTYQHVLTKQKQEAVEALPDLPLYAPLVCTDEKWVMLQ